MPILFNYILKLIILIMGNSGHRYQIIQHHKFHFEVVDTDYSLHSAHIATQFQTITTI
jgi:hypothetical protein